MLIYAVTIFTSAFLLFEVQPMMAKFILPWFGGAQSVWTTCVLFFQLLLLAGYAYAHAVGTILQPRKQAIAHFAMVSTCVLLMAILALAWHSAIMPGPSWKPPNSDFPILRILMLLTVSVGLPYFVLSATGPLLQLWFAKVHPGESPYPLYALSNLGSLVALVTYPIALEPFLTLRSQAHLWSLLYLAFALGIGMSAWPLRKLRTTVSAFEPEASATEEDAASRPTPALYLLWIALPACASLMMLGATNQICENVAAIPFLWVLPLAIYLLSLVVCFGDERFYRRGVFHPALAIATVFAVTLLWTLYLGIIAQIAAYCFLLFCGCMVCHGELVRLKPRERYLTAFYFMVAIGGAVGGLLAAVIAPLIFRGYWEFQLSIWACILLLFIALRWDSHSWVHRRNPVLALALFAAALLLPQLLYVVMGTPTGNPSYYLGAIVSLILISVVAFRERKSQDTGRGGRLVQVSLIAGLLVLGSTLLTSVSHRNSLIAKRNFYGAVVVSARDPDDPAWHAYELSHGRIIHGVQYPEPDKRYRPTTYYGPESGVGLAILHHARRDGSARDGALRLGVVGLGAGTLAAYGRDGDYIRFYEINPAVIQLAADPKGYFSYLHDSRARVDVIRGDARLSMEREVANRDSQQFDVLAIDAFSGDAIPVHLLTREAIAIYLRELKADGILAIHVSNGYLDLVPVAREAAQYFGLQSALVGSKPPGRMTLPSVWVLLARDGEVLRRPEISAHSRSLDSVRKVQLWTDDFSNLFQILK